MEQKNLNLKNNRVNSSNNVIKTQLNFSSLFKKVKDLTVGGGGGSPLKEVGTGIPNIDTTKDSFREGRMGLGEPNPEELLDMVASTADGKGGYKFDYTYSTGEIARVQFGGENITSELGVPAGLVKANLVDFFSVGNQAGWRAFSAVGNIDAISPASGKLGVTVGVQNSVAPSELAYFSVFPIGNDDGTDFIARISADGANGKAKVQAAQKGTSAGEQLQKAAEMDATEDGNTAGVGVTPHYVRVKNLMKLTDYGVGNFQEGVTHTDDIAKTGTAPTVLGSPTFGLGVDQGGNLIEMAVGMTLKRKLTSVEIESLNSSPITLIPAPGVGKIIMIESLAYKGNFVAPGFAAANLSLSYSDGVLYALNGNFNIDFAVDTPLNIMANYQIVKANENTGLVLSSFADSVSSGGTIDVYISYKILTL